MKNYRIVTDGTYFKVQARFLLFFWLDTDVDMYPNLQFAKSRVNTLLELEKEEKEEEKKIWVVVDREG